MLKVDFQQETKTVFGEVHKLIYHIDNKYGSHKQYFKSGLLILIIALLIEINSYETKPCPLPQGYS